MGRPKKMLIILNSIVYCYMIKTDYINTTITEISVTVRPGRSLISTYHYLGSFI